MGDDSMLDEENQGVETPAKIKRLEKTEQEKADLLARIGSSEIATMRHRVAWILNRFPSTRNSDIALQVKYWEIFDKDLYRGSPIAVEDLYKLTRLTSLSRERARIQNQYRLFLADEEVQQRRGTLEEEEREKAIETPDCPVYAVYLDESGKTTDYLIVGSLWFLSSGTEGLELYRRSKELKHKYEFTHEFHFSQLKKDQLQVYKELIDIFVTYGGTISFKSISVPKAGLKNVSSALGDLYYLLLTKGIEHEHSTQRGPLPRILQVWKDAEEIGSDKILMATLADRMKQASSSMYENKLFVQEFVAMDSKSSIFLQAADLIASSVNRILCRREQPRNHKDELADYLVECLGISTSPDLEIVVGDTAVHIRL